MAHVVRAATSAILADFAADISVAQGLFMKAAQPVLMHGSADQAGQHPAVTQFPSSLIMIVKVILGILSSCADCC